MTARYEWTPDRDEVLRARYDSRIKGRAKDLARALGVPKWAVTKRAAELGLSSPRGEFFDAREWTAEEDRKLIAWAGERSLRAIARRLGRTHNAVRNRMRRLKVSCRVSEGYTLRELELCFGVGHRTITRWIDRGWLEADRRDEDGEHPAYQVREVAILRFVQEHPLAFELRRVDQTWFLDLMTSGGVIKKAIATEAAIDRADQEQAA